MTTALLLALAAAVQAAGPRQAPLPEGPAPVVLEAPAPRPGGAPIPAAAGDFRQLAEIPLAASALPAAPAALTAPAAAGDFGLKARISAAAAPAGPLAAMSAGVQAALEQAGDLGRAAPCDAAALGRRLETVLAGGTAAPSAAAPAAPRRGLAAAVKNGLEAARHRLFPRKRVKVALAQIDATVGDFDYNVRHGLRFIRQAAQAGAEVVVLPELFPSAYPPRDLLEYPHFAEANADALRALIAGLKSIPNAPRTVILGSLTRNPEPVGRALQNSAVVIHDGEIVHVQPKRLLPNYDVFDDPRYFEPGRKSAPWTAPWGRTGCLICEDLWGHDQVGGRRLYREDPPTDLKGMRLNVSVNASPFEIGKHAHRRGVVAGAARRSAAPLVYVNAVGSQDELLFDGGSMVLSPDGEVLFEMPRFKEGLAVVELKLGKAPAVLSQAQWEWSEREQRWGDFLPEPAPSELEVLRRALVAGIRGYFIKNGFRKAVLGLSGGIDSSLVASLAVDALGAENVVGVLMPSAISSAGSVSDAAALATNLGLKHVISPIQAAVDQELADIQPVIAELSAHFTQVAAEKDTTEDNVHARERGLRVMALANKFGLLMLNTSNRSEMALGQCTTFGDMAGALAPIVNLFKTQVYELSTLYPQIPESVRRKPASAELPSGVTDEEKFGRWPVVDAVLRMFLEQLWGPEQIVAAGYAREYVLKTLAIVRDNEFKKKVSAIGLKVAPKSFGWGRRVPIAAYFRPVKP